MQAYHCFPCDFRMLLVEVLLKLREFVKVPVLFTQPLAGIAKFALRWPISTATETRRPTISVLRIKKSTTLERKPSKHKDMACVALPLLTVVILHTP